MIFFFYLKDDKKEGFTSKLKLLKDVNHNKRNESNMNSNTLKKKKEKFGSKNTVTYQEYNESFKTYPFTKRSKSSMEALNKMPLYIEKFKEIFN